MATPYKDAEDIADAEGRAETDVRRLLQRTAEAFVRWSIEHPAYAQLMFWRPVPGYEPSPQAYEPAVQLMQRGLRVLAKLRERGTFRSDVDVDELMRAWTAVVSGVISQQLSNAPDESFEEGRFTTLLPRLVEMADAARNPPASRCQPTSSRSADPLRPARQRSAQGGARPVPAPVG